MNRYLQYVRLLTVALMLNGCALPRAVREPDRAVAQAHKQLARGVTCNDIFDRPDNARWVELQRGDFFRDLRRAGFTAVRIPLALDSAPREEEEPGRPLHPAWMDRVDRVVRAADRAGLGVILVARTSGDLHDTATQDRLIADWAHLAAHLKRARSSVVFELLDEPNSRLTDAAWSRLAEEIRLAIRQSNPDRVLLVGPAQRYNPAHLAFLDLPPDPRLMYVFAFDEPVAFTRQIGAWRGTRWDGTPEDTRRIEQDLDRIARWAREHKRLLLCANFGASAEADPASRAQWTFFVSRALEERDIAWIYRSLTGDEGVYDADWRMWRQPLLGALLNQ